ncbi:hypothetical protein F5884DRAFT_58804 [Xylogone sp. PMI_703]|nr:hypothetical protein F5884DRAFT_58804 [Xylogone sp. PMI_703]
MSSKKIVLITGGNSGIGYATAASLIASPTYHVIIGSRSPEKGQTALKSLSAGAKGSISLAQLDVTDSASISAAVSTVEKEHGRLDVLINNAAIGPTTPSLAVDLLRETLESNVLGVAAMTEAFVPLLRKSSDPRIIHVSSGVGSVTLRAGSLEPGAQHFPPFYAYSISKAALNMMALCHMELYKDQIKVIALSPGYVATNLGGNPEAMKQSGAGDPADTGKFIHSVVEGKRDADWSKLIKEEGYYPW